MLVLSRRVGQEILIGENIRVVISQVRGKTVRLAIAAPATVSVQRQELLKRQAEFQSVAGEAAEQCCSKSDP